MRQIVAFAPELPGADWHRDLLLQMSAAIDGVRPPVISQETRFCLDESRGFRHGVRNLYTFNRRLEGTRRRPKDRRCAKVC